MPYKTEMTCSALLLVLLSIVTTASADQEEHYIFSFGWQFGTDENEIIYDLTADAAGNIIVVGTTNGKFSQGSADKRIFANPHHFGTYEGFIRVHDRSGNVLWSRSTGTNLDDLYGSVVINRAGQIAITGKHGRREGLDYHPDGAHFFCLYSMEGEILRFNVQLDEPHKQFYAAALDSSGSMVVGGYIDVNNYRLLPLSADALVARYDATAEAKDFVPLWNQKFGTSGHDLVNTVAVSKGKGLTDIIVAAGTTAGTLEGTSAGNYDAYIRAFDNGGRKIWGRQFGTSTSDTVNAATADAAGNIILVGTTKGHLTDTHIDTSDAGDTDSFVRVYDRSGNVLWTRQFGTHPHGNDKAGAVTVSPAGNIIVAGKTKGSLEGTNAGDYDAFIRAYDIHGNKLWGTQFGTPGYDTIEAATVDADGRIIVAGNTTGALEGTNAGDRDGFIRVYAIAPNLVKNDSFEAVTVTQNDGKWELFANGTANLEWTVTSNYCAAEMEVQRNMSDGAQDGSQYVELGSQCNMTISQTIPTVEGKTYELSYYSKQRPGERQTSGFATFIDNRIVDYTFPLTTSSGTRQTITSDWTKKAITFTAANDTTTIAFMELAKSDGYGALLDNVSVRLK